MTDRDSARRSNIVRGGEWPTRLPLAFAMLALVVLVALPIAAERYARPLNRELREVVEPARELVTRVHVELAIQGSAFHDYYDSGDSLLLQRYRQAHARELDAQREIGKYVRDLGDTVQFQFDRLQALEQRWHQRVATLIGAREAGREPPDAVRAEEDLYEELLIAAADLDDILARAARGRRTKVIDAERMQRRITIVIGLISLAALGGVAWLANRVRIYAHEAEDRRIQLERATESRERLMRGVSHDLKNPLGAIDGHAALLADGLKGPLTDGQRDSIARIRNSVRAMLGLITDLLELSKAESGHLAVRPRPTNVADVVRDATEEHRDAAVAAGHQLWTEVKDGVPTIQTDPDRVRQILGNLLSNAVKYTPRGGQIVVRLEERQGNGSGQPARYAAIDVIDSGPGIPRQQLDEIFEEFTRLETTATPGSGLGLTIARRVSRLLGGDISATSEAGRGTTFTLWLPVDRVTAERRVSDHRALR